jgi:uncharacterized RDD family membrane protein YckC
MMSFERQDFGSEQHSVSAETHSIGTPEQVDLEYNIAGVGSRFVAILLDKLILLACCIVLFLLGLILFGAFSGVLSHMNMASNWFVAILIFIVFLIGWGYFGLFEAFWHGQTPGKRMMKLRVIKDSGRQITLFESLARNLLRYIDYLPGAYLVGIITMLCNKRNKRLGDFAAGTIVVHERMEEQPLLVQAGSSSMPRSENAPWQPEPWMQTIPTLFPADAVAKLGAQDLVLMEAFFSRALDLALDTRATMAERIARQMAAKMGVALPEGNPERALESLIFAMRGSGKNFTAR